MSKRWAVRFTARKRGAEAWRAAWFSRRSRFHKWFFAVVLSV